MTTYHSSYAKFYILGLYTKVSQIDSVLKEKMPAYKGFLSGAHFQYFCDHFIDSFASRFINALYKTKHISVDGAQQLQLDVSTLKVSLLAIAGT